jgi:carboxymethylenebutenolidase
MNYFQKYLIEEFAEDYQSGQISHSQALKLIAGVTRDADLAGSILAAHRPISTKGGANALQAHQSRPVSSTHDEELEHLKTNSENRPEIRAGTVNIPSQDEKLTGYLALPLDKDGPWPVILVCHENRGLTEHIKDVTRRLSREGYVALAVDLLSRQGGTDAHPRDEVPGLLGNIPPEQFVSDFYAGWRFLESKPIAIAQRMGMMGFCFGGGVTWLMSTQMPELKAATPFYGPHPPLEDVPKINAAVLAVYGELDQRINQGIPEIEDAMHAHEKVFKKLVYPNAGHAFFNDTSERYVPEAARDAWQQALAWFEKWV